MERPCPPFRADHVGSLVRPPELIQARKDKLSGRITAEELRRVEDRAIREVVAMQERLGLRSITDGEYRRTTYLVEFFSSIGIDLLQQESTDLFYEDGEGHTIPATKAEVRRRIEWKGSVNVDAFKFLKSVTAQTPKVTVPAPTQVHFFAGADGISKAVYSDEERFWDDMVDAYHAEFAALAAAGCNFVQIDETSLPKLADAKIQDVIARRGRDWRALVDTYANAMNRILAGKPAGMEIGVHHCRGNAGKFWQAQAGYDLVAETMFGKINAKSYFLEYDTPRAGDFSPLCYMPKDKVAVLGLVSTKNPVLEPVDELKRRIEEASRYVDLERLCLAPQCGFSSGFASAPLTLEQEVAKLERIVEVAREVWGA